MPVYVSTVLKKSISLKELKYLVGGNQVRGGFSMFFNSNFSYYTPYLYWEGGTAPVELHWNVSCLPSTTLGSSPEINSWRFAGFSVNNNLCYLIFLQLCWNQDIKCSL